jgi:hypothetical protein
MEGHAQMRRLKDVPPAEMPEVLRVASELYARDRAELERTEQSHELKQAAAELDLPPEYLERAAAAVHAERVAQIQTTRRRRNSALAVLGVTLGIWGGWRVTHPPPPEPVAYTFSAASRNQWTLDRNPGSEARLTFDERAGSDGAALVTVDRFGAQGGDGRFFVNLNSTQVPPSLAGYRTVGFRARGDGLAQVRLYLEAGPTERWRSPAVPVSGSWSDARLQLNQFDYQTRRSPSEEWRTQRYRSPGQIERLSFKLGYYVNEADARGTVAIDDLRFE